MVWTEFNYSHMPFKLKEGCGCVNAPHCYADVNNYPQLKLDAGFVNSLRLRQNECHFADDTFKHIFLNKNHRILIKNSLKFVPKGPINNTPALVQIMAWRRPGDKPLSEPMIVSLSMHIRVTRPQWVNDDPDLYCHFMSLGHNDLEQLCVYCLLIINKHHILNDRMRLNVTILFKHYLKMFPRLWIVTSCLQKYDFEHIISLCQISWWIYCMLKHWFIT